MGWGFARQQLVGRINEAFAPAAIAAAAQVAAPLGPQADAFDIVHATGAFQFPEGVTLDSYRDSLPIPPLNKAVLAEAFRYAVRNSIPLSFAIASGHAESVQVTTSDTLISVVLTRVD